MNTRNMEIIELTIPDMKSAHCQMTVTHTVAAIGGKVRAVVPGRAEIELSRGLTRKQVVQAIQKSGYNVVNGTI